MHLFPILLTMSHGQWSTQTLATTQVCLNHTTQVNYPSVTLFSPLGQLYTKVIRLKLYLKNYGHGAGHGTGNTAAFIRLEEIGLLLGPFAEIRQYAADCHDFDDGPALKFHVKCA